MVGRVTVAVSGAVSVDAVEAWGGDGGDVAAFEDAGRSTHAVALGDSAGTGCRSRSVSRSRSRLGAIARHGERGYIGTTTHVGFA